MTVLVWKHGRSKADAIAAIQGALKDSGYSDSAKWDGDSAEARYGPWATVLHAKGVVTDDAIVLEKCGGVAGGIVLGRCRTMLEGLFPGGEQPPT
jgi:hypothetical protein